MFRARLRQASLSRHVRDGGCVECIFHLMVFLTYDGFIWMQPPRTSREICAGQFDKNVLWCPPLVGIPQGQTVATPYPLVSLESIQCLDLESSQKMSLGILASHGFFQYGSRANTSTPLVRLCYTGAQTCISFRMTCKFPSKLPASHVTPCSPGIRHTAVASWPPRSPGTWAPQEQGTSLLCSPPVLYSPAWQGPTASL